MFYFDLAHAIRVHDRILDLSGGLAGVKDAGQLESVLAHIQDDLYYPSLEEKLTHLVFSVIQFHCFNDGNKRSALALGAYFLEINGYEWLGSHFIQEMENIVVWVAEGRIRKELLFRIIAAICDADDFPECLKLDIIHALGD